MFLEGRIETTVFQVISYSHITCWSRYAFREVRAQGYSTNGVYKVQGAIHTSANYSRWGRL